MKSKSWMVFVMLPLLAAGTLPASVQAEDPPAATPVQASEGATDEANQERPVQPSRDQVRAAIEAVVGTAQQCAPSYRGTVVPTKLTIAKTGRVTVARVEGALAGTSQGSCIARALREARTPEFTGPRLQVAYPIRL